MDRLNLSSGDFTIECNKHTYRIFGYIMDFVNNVNDLNVHQFKEGKLYADEAGKLWMYSKAKKKRSVIPTFSWEQSGENEINLIFAECSSSEMESMFNIEFVEDNSIQTIDATSDKNETLYNPEILNYMNAATSTFHPEIKETDDFLKKIVKLLLIVKNTNINQFCPFFPKKHFILNLKTQLQNDTKTSTKNYDTWMELCNTDFMVIVRNAGPNTAEWKDYDNPLPGYIVYDSKTNQAKHVDELTLDDLHL